MEREADRQGEYDSVGMIQQGREGLAKAAEAVEMLQTTHSMTACSETSLLILYPSVSMRCLMLIWKRGTSSRTVRRRPRLRVTIFL